MIIKMPKKKLISIALFSLLNAPFVGASSQENVEAVVIEKGVVLDRDKLIPVSLVINEGSPAEAWLDITSDFKFIFVKKTETIEDIMSVLNGLKVSKSLRFTCENSTDLFCKKYKYFILSYDYETGKLVVIYQSLKDEMFIAPSEAAVGLSQTMSYSQSSSDGYAFTTGNWYGDLNVGLTEASSLTSSLSYDFELKKLQQSGLAYAHDFNDGRSFSVYYSEPGLSEFSNLMGSNARGVNFTWGNATDSDDVGSAAPIIVDAKYNSILNVYDENGKLIQSMQAEQGINRIDLPSSTVANRVRIEEVADGRIMNSYERNTNIQGGSGTSISLDAGIATIEKEFRYSKYRWLDDEALSQKSSQKDQGDTPYVRYSQRVKNVEFKGTYFSRVDWSTTSLRYNGIPGLDVGIESTFKEQIKKHDINIGYNGEFGGVNYYGTLSKGLGNTKRLSKTAGVSMPVFEKSRVDVFYTQSHSVTTPIDFSKYFRRPRHPSKSSSDYRKLSLRFKSSSDTQVGRFDYSFNLGSDLRGEKSVGVSLTFTPESKSRWIKPSAGAEFNGKTNTTYVKNSMNPTDDLTLVPEIQFANNVVSNYGVSSTYKNDYLNGGGSVYKSPEGGQSLYLSGSSNVLLSKYGVVSSSEDKNTVYVFKNESGRSDQKIPVDFSINGSKKELSDGSIIYTDAKQSSLASIYTEAMDVAMKSEYAKMHVKPYRVYVVEYKHEDNKIFVSGRVLNGDKPAVGVAVVNHVGKAVSDQDGYFSLQVSRENPVVSLYSNGQPCHTQIDDVLKNSQHNSSEVYLGRLQCVQ
ncbi:CS1-pili formation C-terminal domain-containing protein [Pseudomonas caspiana]|uniref:Pilus assembly protein C-terminal domain-containing protein n=1 Tax=Pseudomonas caspiana TaxID=1451454 RepID=A0A1Y3NWG2_9PSED|nr:CS1-pili formation C-terminal domain-containing protein [Pseudomonas caspiana]OUM71887.1 hypothetical protein AUC60_21430 [Pseudomonas caspiana]